MGEKKNWIPLWGDFSPEQFKLLGENVSRLDYAKFSDIFIWNAIRKQ